MSRVNEARDILAHVAEQTDQTIDLGEAALALAALAGPTQPLERYRRHLAALARDVADRHAPHHDADTDGLEARVDTLHQVLVVRHGFVGDTESYDDLENANLMRVIDRRRGLPVALGILYLHAARAQGWRIEGLNFPGHFLVRMECQGERAILDPFNDGRVRSTADLRALLKAAVGGDAELEPHHYAEVGNREILLRLQNNLKLRHLSSEAMDKALAVLEGMRLFAPAEAEVWREIGMVHALLGDTPRAIAALEMFLTLARDDNQLHHAALMIQRLKTHPL